MSEKTELQTSPKEGSYAIMIDFVCGSLSGLANCMSGYIFDTIKVKMQMNSSLKMGQYLKGVIREGKFLSLFDGIYYPLITVPVINAVVFGSYEFYKKITNKKQLSFWDGIENGAFAGLVNTAVVSPVELIKCRMQLNKGQNFKTSRECFKFIMKHEGIRGLYTGSVSTMLREIPAYAAQFATYQILKDWITSKQHPTMSFLEACAVGGMAGVHCWIFSYPQDVVKTKLQVCNQNTYTPHRWLPDGGFISCGKEIYRQAGIKGFFVGLKPCLVRAVVANAFGIAVYEQAQTVLSPRQVHLP